MHPAAIVVLVILSTSGPNAQIETASKEACEVTRKALQAEMVEQRWSGKNTLMACVPVEKPR